MKVLHVLLLTGLMLASCGQSNKEKESAEEAVETEMSEAYGSQEEEVALETIVGVASGNESFSTLVVAVQAADLVGTLSSEGPFTVFAPTNESFAKLPEGTVESLLQSENKSALINLLTYHVVAGKFPASAVIEAINSNGGSFVVETVQGDKITLSLEGESVKLVDAKGNASLVIMADVPASNGVIHAIDAVIMPAG
ncbi:Uncaracterized surface protein containing fasciclin (FAS1) repeats [Muriicola jejuensis]|uniref:Fasciclin domain-containing protein n=1 Tax=Muriicola jejuensis TaxID=504488 RepID=A0A6P0UDG2_9FLAO|nr:fasciclin domain-containing protein [Muriicola jejuensis]NER11294.1 fasciclin domain-containing protein [Muriicola jejuensis]SMP21681.1 Uncaracterized surface protein containing fasciclin (FAS1) repeats [Muriicola jejuensis]